VSGRNEINIVGLIGPHERTGEGLLKIVRWSFISTRHHSVADCSVITLRQTVSSEVRRVLLEKIWRSTLLFVKNANSFTS